jgi:hypothetical protein
MPDPEDDETDIWIDNEDDVADSERTIAFRDPIVGP